jgi:uncharacterized RDD family membrane protein YckC
MMHYNNLTTLGTPAGVLLQVALAGIASRLFAACIDGVLMGVVLGLLCLFVLKLSQLIHLPELFQTLFPLLLLGVTVGYPLLFEWLWQGKSPGKILLQIQVIRLNGQPIGFWEAFGRTLMRVLDIYMGGVGLLFILFTQSEKRLGDMVAGTMVIKQPRQASSLLNLNSQETQPTATPQSPQSHSLCPLTSEETLLLESYFAREKAFLGNANQLLLKQLLHYFSIRWNHPVTSAEQLAQALLHQP